MPTVMVEMRPTLRQRGSLAIGLLFVGMAAVMAATTTGTQRTVTMVAAALLVATMLAVVAWVWWWVRVTVVDGELRLRTVGRQRVVAAAQLQPPTVFRTEPSRWPGSWWCWTTVDGQRVWIASSDYWREDQLHAAASAIGIGVDDLGEVAFEDLRAAVPTLPWFFDHPLRLGAVFLAYVAGILVLAAALVAAVNGFLRRSVPGVAQRAAPPPSAPATANACGRW